MDGIDTLIVGGGIAGVATAYWLARSGAQQVVLLEREDGLGWHSSGLNAGILRSAIDAPETRQLALETSAFLESPPPGFSDHPLLDGRGLVVVEGRAGGPEPRWVAPLREAGVLEAYALDALAGRVPIFQPEGARAWLFPRAGQIDIAGLVARFAAGARAAGAELRTGACAARLLADSAGGVVGVELASGERLEAQRVVVAAGGWAGRLAETAGARFPGRPTRRHLFVTRADRHVQRDWPIVWDDAAGFYALPEGEGLMVCLSDQDDVDPDACAVDPLIRRVLERRLANSLPALDGIPIERTWAAMRTVTEDDRPVVGSDPDVPGLFWVAALGGHGMSISAALGRVAADLILGRQVDPVLVRGLAPDTDERAYVPLRDYR